MKTIIKDWYFEDKKNPDFCSVPKCGNKAHVYFKFRIYISGNPMDVFVLLCEKHSTTKDIILDGTI